MTGALERRIIEELMVTEKQCGCIGCENQATHTWSGHPTCDECGLPGTHRDFPIIITIGDNNDS